MNKASHFRDLWPRTRGNCFASLESICEDLKGSESHREVHNHDTLINHRGSAWAAIDLVDGLTASEKFREAVRWYESVQEYSLICSNQQESTRVFWPANIKLFSANH